MWNSFGSLRERVREHAKSAAQVAQGVLQAAAAEEHYPSDRRPEDQQDENAKDWGGWGPDQDHDSSPFDEPAPQPQPETLPPDTTVPPLAEDAPPPPPPQDSFISAKPPVLNAAPRSRRASRYVVTGVATSQPQPAAPVVPKPSFFAPKPPSVTSQPGDGPVHREADKGDGDSVLQADALNCPVDEEPATDVPSNLPAEPDSTPTALVQQSAETEKNVIPEESSAFSATVTEPAKTEEDLFGEEGTTAPPADDSFADWDLPAEQQNSQSTTAAPADDTFPGWGIEVTAMEHQQPENVPPPPADESVAPWGVPETATEHQQDQAVEATPVDENFKGWHVPAASAETPAEQQSRSTVADPEKDIMSASWDVPKTTTEHQQDEAVEATPVDKNFNGWDVPEATAEIPAETQSRSTVADPEKDIWSQPEKSMEPQEVPSTTERPVEDSFANWNVSETPTQKQRAQGSEALPSQNICADWNVPEAMMETPKRQSAEAGLDADNFVDWSVPETTMEGQKGQRAASTRTENTFADWSAPDTSTADQQNEQNVWDIPSSGAKSNGTAQENDAQTEDMFADWGETDTGWNLDGGSSEVQNAGDGVDWFSNAGVQDTSDGPAKEAATRHEASSKDAQVTDPPEPEQDNGPVVPQLLSTPIESEVHTVGKDTKEEYDMQSVSASQSDAGKAGATENAENEDNDDENIKLENSARIPDVALHQEASSWSFDATVPVAENGTDATSCSTTEGQWNSQTGTTVIYSQEPASQKPIISTGPVPPTESWFSDLGTQQAERESPQDTVPQGAIRHEPPLHEPRSTPQPEQVAFVSEPSEMALQIRELQEQMHNFMLERDSAIAAKETSERENDDLKRSMTLIESDLGQSREESGYLAAQRDVLQKERDAALEQKLEVEKERDEAIQRGGEGLREARNVIEVIRSNQDSTEKREAAITEQIETLRTDLDRISQERNSLLGETEDLRVSLRDMESQSRQKEDELRQRLQIAEHECEIARLEREKALETNELHIDENRKLTDSEKGRAAALAASESRVVELENYIATMQTDREDENVRIELFSKQIEEMKDRTQGVIDERNGLYDEKRNLENQIEEYEQREEAYTRDLQDAKREAASFASEREETKQRFMSMKDQHKELAARVEALAGERDQLVHARTAATTSSSSVSEKEKALAMECEQKTRAVAILQKKLTSAVAKIEKVTAQRGTFQRQRDEAGARLRAAGAEFVALNSKLEELSIAKNTVQNQLVQIRNDRDTALSKVEEMIALDSQLKFIQDSLDSKTKEIEDVQSKLKESKQEVVNMRESNTTAQNKAISLATELCELQGRLEVVSREKDLINKQKDDLEEERSVLQRTVSEREGCEAKMSKQVKSIEADYTTFKEKSAIDLGIAKAELASEQKLHQDLKVKLSDLQNEISQYTSGVDQIRSTVASCVGAIRSDIGQGSEVMSSVEWQGIDDLLTSEDAATCLSTANLVSRYSEVTTRIIRDGLRVAHEHKTLQANHDHSTKMLAALEQEKTELLVGTSEVETLRAEMGEARRDLETVNAEKALMEAEIGNLQEQLGGAAAQRAEVEARLAAMSHEMQEEMQRRIQASTEEREGFLLETEKITTNLNSIWSMLRKSLGQEQLEVLTDEASQTGETDDGDVAVLALRATASIVAEVSRNRSHIEDTESELVTAEAECARLIDRAEIAEQERDTAKGTNERLERKLKVSHEEGKEEAKTLYEGVIGQLEDDLSDTRQELSRISDKASRSEKETSELRALCSKLTSQFNGRTNELDEAEEKIVYLQDQVTTLEEDLEEAHARLKKLEEESTEARQSDVKRLTDKLDETTSQLEEIEKECARLREAHDEAENIAKESQLLAETHKQAEENLQIAIEQLEAAQDSAVEQRTIDLQKKLEDAEQRCKAATEREAAAAVTQKQLNIRDDEIKELRGAIGRLADERVELKLELEKSLSRLNHPDAGGQLVDRRVVRQLLVSYFRVGSVRRRDVLELMSRMLAFSDADNIAVGLKRRALMARLGSLVQAPELDDASLPPLGTVSDKWIEFLMKETEEGEEQAKGW